MNIFGSDVENAPPNPLVAPLIGINNNMPLDRILVVVHLILMAYKYGDFGGYSSRNKNLVSIQGWAIQHLPTHSNPFKGC